MISSAEVALKLNHRVRLCFLEVIIHLLRIIPLLLLVIARGPNYAWRSNVSITKSSNHCRCNSVSSQRGLVLLHWALSFSQNLKLSLTLSHEKDSFIISDISYFDSMDRLSKGKSDSILVISELLNHLEDSHLPELFRYYGIDSDLSVTFKDS